LSYKEEVTFNRDYRLYVKDGSRVFVVEPPLRIVFDGTKNTGLNSAFGSNSFNFKIYGLRKENRDIFIKQAAQKKSVSLELKVGYEGRLDTIFLGMLFRGSVQLDEDGFVVKASAFAGGAAYMSSYTSKTVTTKSGAVDALINDMSKIDPTAQRGSIMKFSDLVRPKVLVGNSTKLIQESLADDEEFFIDNGLVNIKKKNDVIGSYIPLVSAETGLLNTPERDFLGVKFETLLNPSIKIGSSFKLESKVIPQYNGIYQAISISYSGDNEGDDWKQGIVGRLT